MINRVLMVCIGNICRSPMAEGLLRAHALPVTVSSAGIYAMVGCSADPLAEQLMFERDIDITAHRARQITEALLVQSNLILVMETRHQQMLENQFSFACGRIYRLGKWSGFDVPDPYGKPRQEFERVLALIEQGLEDWKLRI